MRVLFLKKVFFCAFFVDEWIVVPIIMSIGK